MPKKSSPHLSPFPPHIFDTLRALTLQSTFSIVNVPLVLAPCNVLTVVPHQSTPPLMFLVPLLRRDIIRLPAATIRSALRHILHLCDIGPLLVQAENRCEPTPRQPPFDSVPNQHSSPYAALSLSRWAHQS